MIIVRTPLVISFVGSRLAERADLAFVAQSHDMQQVEDAHMIAAHMVMQAV